MRSRNSFAVSLRGLIKLGQVCAPFDGFFESNGFADRWGRQFGDWDKLGLKALLAGEIGSRL